MSHRTGFRWDDGLAGPAKRIAEKRVLSSTPMMILTEGLI